MIWIILIGGVFAVLGFISVKSIGKAIINALIQGKGVDIGFKTTWFGIPYSIGASVK